VEVVKFLYHWFYFEQIDECVMAATSTSEIPQKSFDELIEELENTILVNSKFRSFPHSFTDALYEMKNKIQERSPQTLPAFRALIEALLKIKTPGEISNTLDETLNSLQAFLPVEPGSSSVSTPIDLFKKKIRDFLVVKELLNILSTPVEISEASLNVDWQTIQTLIIEEIKSTPKDNPSQLQKISQCLYYLFPESFPHQFPGIPDFDSLSNVTLPKVFKNIAKAKNLMILSEGQEITREQLLNAPITPLYPLVSYQSDSDAPTRQKSFVPIYYQDEHGHFTLLKHGREEARISEEDSRWRTLQEAEGQYETHTTQNIWNYPFQQWIKNALLKQYSVDVPPEKFFVLLGLRRQENRMYLEIRQTPTGIKTYFIAIYPGVRFSSASNPEDQKVLQVPILMEYELTEHGFLFQRILLQDKTLRNILVNDPSCSQETATQQIAARFSPPPGAPSSSQASESLPGFNDVMASIHSAGLPRLEKSKRLHQLQDMIERFGNLQSDLNRQSISFESILEIQKLVFLLEEILESNITPEERLFYENISQLIPSLLENKLRTLPGASDAFETINNPLDSHIIKAKLFILIMGIFSFQTKDEKLLNIHEQFTTLIFRYINERTYLNELIAFYNHARQCMKKNDFSSLRYPDFIPEEERLVLVSTVLLSTTSAPPPPPPSSTFFPTLTVLEAIWSIDPNGTNYLQDISVTIRNSQESPSNPAPMTWALEQIENLPESQELTNYLTTTRTLPPSIQLFRTHIVILLAYENVRTNPTDIVNIRATYEARLRTLYPRGNERVYIAALSLSVPLTSLAIAAIPSIILLGLLTNPFSACMVLGVGALGGLILIGVFAIKYHQAEHSPSNQSFNQCRSFFEFFAHPRASTGGDSHAPPPPSSLALPLTLAHPGESDSLPLLPQPS